MARHTVWTPQKEAIALAMRAEGATNAAIGERIGIKAPTVSFYFWRKGMRTGTVRRVTHKTPDNAPPSPPRADQYATPSIRRFSWEA